MVVPSRILRSQRFSWRLRHTIARSPGTLLGLGVGLVLGLSLGLCISGARGQTDTPSPFRGLGRLAEVVSLTDLHYVEPVDMDRALEGAVRGFVGTLDPHSAYLDPEEHALFESHTAGQFVGIGVEIQLRDGWLLIGSVFPDGPAANGGMQVGDRILSIDGHVARDMAIEDAVRLVRGQEGTSVTFSLRREGVADAVELRLVRAPVRIHAVESRLLADDTVYITIRTFQESTAEELRRALDDAVAATAPRHGVRGVILDLRDNGGGLLFQAVEVADEFLASGVIVSTRGRGGRLIDETSAHRRGTRPDWPLVVLVNGFTASASEIVAGALRDHRRAVVVGTRTFGKGSVQNVIPISTGGALKLTVARYHTPSGRSIQAEGIEPDVVVDRITGEALEAARAQRPDVSERTLERHLGAGTQVPDPPSSFELFPDDYQAAMAHQTLRAIGVTGR